MNETKNTNVGKKTTKKQNSSAAKKAVQNVVNGGAG